MEKQYKKLLLQKATEDMVLGELATLALKDGILSNEESKEFMKGFQKV